MSRRLRNRSVFVCMRICVYTCDIVIYNNRHLVFLLVPGTELLKPWNFL